MLGIKTNQRNQTPRDNIFVPILDTDKHNYNNRLNSNI